MSLACCYTNTHLHNLPFFRRKSYKAREFRVYRRRRIKTWRRFSVMNRLGPFENLFNSLTFQFPSVNSLDLIAPALGLASGAALYFSRLKTHDSASGVLDIGEWVLFTSPTPFNRFVMLRCPSISFQGSELLEDVNDRLLKEESHSVTLSSGKIQVNGGDRADIALKDPNFDYQRVCVTTEDGGVISIDWPANLALEEVRGLDTTLLLVPGTPEGSLDKYIKLFVIDALKRGFFPIVMNPRGCAGSPLTTARLFAAADSDDICTAIQYINKARPWTTLMAVGWGYGANMLTKYLAEVGASTPLTAATCIDNPFDLEEASRLSPYSNAMDEKLTVGLINILRNNKELFQGKTKPFEVEKALLSKTLRDFEKAISMVSYGCETIEDFYSRSSTRDVVANVKVPLLFIQSNDGSAPVFSIPRSLIAENPYTSLLLCSYLPPSVFSADSSAMSWCRLLTIEWLTAVELGLLKGRHPLLKDIDVTVNPSKGLSLVEEKISKRSSKVGKYLDMTKTSSADEYSTDPIYGKLEEINNAASFSFSSAIHSPRNLGLPDSGLQVANGAVEQATPLDTELDQGENVSSVDPAQGQAVQTTQVVMNMLDVTMPGMLTEYQKKKVLTAVSQGESIMKALQDAVPDDVREKLTSAATAILHAQGTNLKFNEVLRVAHSLDKSPATKAQDNLRNAEDCPEDNDSPNRERESTDYKQASMDEKSAAESDSELWPIEKHANSLSSVQAETISNDGIDSPVSFRKDTNETRGNDVNEEFKVNDAPSADTIERGSESSDKLSTQTEGVDDLSDVSIDENKNQTSETSQLGTIAMFEQKTQTNGTSQLDAKEDNGTQKTEDKVQDHLTEQSQLASFAEKDESPMEPALSSETQTTEREGDSNQKRDDRNALNSSDQAKSSDPSPNPNPTFSVSHALEALTGIDDSTQVAVNSIFGVIEDMITEFEGNSDTGDEAKNIINRNQKSGENENNDNTHSKPAAPVQEENSLSSQPVVLDKKVTQNLISSNDKCMVHSHVQHTDDHFDQGIDKTNGHLIVNKLDNSDRSKPINGIPQYIAASSVIGNEHILGYLVSKMPRKSLDLDATTALLLDYFPEEGQWKLLEQPKKFGTFHDSNSTDEDADTNGIIEPSYAIMNAEEKPQSVDEDAIPDEGNCYFEVDVDTSNELMQFVKNIVLDSLKVEVGRRLSAADMKAMESKIGRDLKCVADAVAEVVGYNKDCTYVLRGLPRNNLTNAEAGTLCLENIVRAISSSIQRTSCLRKVLPVGVIVGSTLAALRKYFNVSMSECNGKTGSFASSKTRISDVHDHSKASIPKTDGGHVPKAGSGHWKGAEHEPGSEKIINKATMVGAVTAALGASAFLVEHQNSNNRDAAVETSSQSFKVKGHQQKESLKLENMFSDKNNVVTSLAEKAMSVAGPVVPTKEGGGLDQERLVAMLTDLGQKGGMLKLVSKLALLWGGIRGAMSLTDKLISFFHIGDCPLLQRMLGFVAMVLVLWSPTLVPLLPAIVQSWTTNSSSKMAEFACTIGLYIAVLMLVTIWGKRVRGYQNALMQYGLDLTSFPKLQDFMKGLIGGIAIVLSIHSINILLGCASFSWPSNLSCLDVFTRLKVLGKLFLLVSQGIVTAGALALVEELLFRSWLPEEIALDLGYRQGIFISGLVFSLFQRSPQAIPGLWLLSLALAGARQRNGGSLSVPIGLHAGIMASSFTLQRSGLLSYNQNLPVWVAGTRPFQPFSSAVGLAFSFSLAILLYPRQPLQEKILKRKIID